MTSAFASNRNLPTSVRPSETNAISTVTCRINWLLGALLLGPLMLGSFGFTPTNITATHPTADQADVGDASAKPDKTAVASTGSAAVDTESATVKASPKPKEPNTDAVPQSRLANRILLTGAVLCIVLAWLGTAYAYLKINHATRGFYSGRLQSLAISASLLVLVCAAAFYFAWMQV